MTPKARKRRERHGAERRWFRYARERHEIHARMRADVIATSAAAMNRAIAPLVASFITGLTSGIVTFSVDTSGGPADLFDATVRAAREQIAMSILGDVR